MMSVFGVRPCMQCGETAICLGDRCRACLVASIEPADVSKETMAIIVRAFLRAEREGAA